MPPKKRAPKIYASLDIEGKTLRLPATFWGEGYAKDTYGDQWDKNFTDIVIGKWRKATAKQGERWSFTFVDEAEYVLPLLNSDDDQDATTYMKRGLFGGTNRISKSCVV